MIDPFITLFMAAYRLAAVVIHSVIVNHHRMGIGRARIVNDRMAAFPVLPKVHALTVDSNQRHVSLARRKQ